MKQPYDEHKSQIDPIHQAEDWNDCQSCHPFDFHKMINLEGDSQEEDSPGEEDFPEEEDSPEEEDTLEEEEYHQEDHQEEVGDHHQCPCRRPNKENW